MLLRYYDIRRGKSSWHNKVEEEEEEENKGRISDEDQRGETAIAQGKKKLIPPS